MKGNTCDGESIISFYHCHMNITDSVFEGNQADKRNGGSLYAYRSVLNIDNSIFYKNVAVNWGGAIFANESDVTLSDVNFIGIL